MTTLLIPKDAPTLSSRNRRLEKPPPDLARRVRYLKILLIRERYRSARLERLAENDDLTGATNRRGFMKALEQTLSHRRRYGNPASLAFFDLDGFKAVNDRHGHCAGDEVLRRLTSKLAEHVRASDVIGRLGGDEFAVIFQNARPADLGPRLSVLEQDIAGLDKELGGSGLSLSSGVTELRPTDSAAEALDRADRLMYRSKALLLLRTAG